MKIEVSEEVGREIDRLCVVMNTSVDVVLRRALRFGENSNGSFPSLPTPTPHGEGGLRTRSCVLKMGLKLRALYKGQEYQGHIQPGALVVDGINKKFTSPSLAAVAITSYPVNGWQFWEYRDEQSGEWRTLDELRR